MFLFLLLNSEISCILINALFTSVWIISSLISVNISQTRKFNVVCRCLLLCMKWKSMTNISSRAFSYLFSRPQYEYNVQIIYFDFIQAFIHRVPFLFFTHIHWVEWSLTLREERRLRVFENRILRRIFGLKRDENGDCRRLHYEKLHSLYRWPNLVRVIKCKRSRWAGHVAIIEEVSSFKTGMVNIPEGDL